MVSCNIFDSPLMTTVQEHVSLNRLLRLEASYKRRGTCSAVGNSDSGTNEPTQTGLARNAWQVWQQRCMRTQLGQRKCMRPVDQHRCGSGDACSQLYVCPAQEPIKVLWIVNGNALLSQLVPERGMIFRRTAEQQVIDIDIQEQFEWLHPVTTRMVSHCNTATRDDSLVQVSLPMASSFWMAV